MITMKERDQELVLFLEMRRREKENERNTFLLLLDFENDVVVDASHLEFSRGNSSLVSSGNDMSDYDWLLTPPGTPLFPTLEKEPQISAKDETEISRAQTTALKPRETNIITEPASRRIIATKTRKVMPNNTNRRLSSPSPSRSSTLSSRTKSSKALLTLTSAKPIRSTTPISSSSTSKICPALAKNPAKSQVSLLDAPPKMKASLPERPALAFRCSRLSSLEAKDSNISGRPKRPILRSKSCSINDGENDRPGMIGTKMVDRIVNMRKLAPPKKLIAGHHSAVHNSSGKSDRSAFGRSFSKKSLDMAMRHMDI